MCGTNVSVCKRCIPSRRLHARAWKRKTYTVCIPLIRRCLFHPSSVVVCSSQPARFRLSLWIFCARLRTRCFSSFSASFFCVSYELISIQCCSPFSFSRSMLNVDHIARDMMHLPTQITKMTDELMKGNVRGSRFR